MLFVKSIRLQKPSTTFQNKKKTHLYKCNNPVAITYSTLNLTAPELTRVHVTAIATLRVIAITVARLIPIHDPIATNVP